MLICSLIWYLLLGPWSRYLATAVVQLSRGRFLATFLHATILKSSNYIVLLYYLVHIQIVLQKVAIKIS
jgi:hypothetical protein